MSEDRERLNELLTIRGYHARGGLILVRPEWSRIQGVHQSEKAVIIEATVDVGESFAPDGLRLERFRKNPVVLWHHNYDGLPVARSLWERVRLNADEPVLITKMHVFVCDVCGKERSEVPFSKCEMCDKEVCGSCAACTEYDDELVCKACKKVGAPYEKKISDIEEAAEIKREKVMEQWKVKALEARDE